MLEIDNNEQMLRIVRKHWFVLLSDLALLIVAFVIPVIPLSVFHFLPLEAIVSWSGTPAPALGFLIIAWFFVVWMLGWILWTNYYLDVLIVTNTRIFTIKQQGLFRRISSSFRIDRIQSATVDQRGILQTLLNFGTIHIETAGENEDFVGTFIARPYDLKKFINEMQDAAAERVPPAEATGE